MRSTLFLKPMVRKLVLSWNAGKAFLFFNLFSPSGGDYETDSKNPRTCISNLVTRLYCTHRMQFQHGRKWKTKRKYFKLLHSWSNAGFLYDPRYLSQHGQSVSLVNRKRLKQKRTEVYCSLLGGSKSQEQICVLFSILLDRRQGTVAIRILIRRNDREGQTVPYILSGIRLYGRK